MSFQAYQNMKPTRIAACSSIPNHWHALALKRIVASDRPITYGIVQAGPNVEGGIPYIRPADMSDEDGVSAPESLLHTTAEIANAYARSSVREGDLVCSIGPSFGKVMIVPRWLQGANLTQGTARVAIRQSAHTRYFFWVLRSASSFQQWESSVGGATFRALNLGPLAETLVPFPPLAEQQAIAEFLDRETAKIDALVAEQRRLIELLKEKRQAVISHAVTKGLDPNAKMKPSGIEWLGDVPEHWNVPYLNQHVASTNGFGFSSSDFGTSGVPLIRAGNIKNKTVTAADVFIPEEITVKHGRIVLREGDVIISMVGSDPRVLDSAVGQLAIVPPEIAGAVPNQNVVILREKSDQLLKKYLFYALCGSGYRAHLDVFSHKLANQSIISSSLILKARFALPPLREQLSIISYLDRFISEQAILVGHAESSINMLQERRTALISAAVTGKIDVRHLANQEAA